MFTRILLHISVLRENDFFWRGRVCELNRLHMRYELRFVLFDMKNDALVSNAFIFRRWRPTSEPPAHLFALPLFYPHTDTYFKTNFFHASSEISQKIHLISEWLHWFSVNIEQHISSRMIKHRFIISIRS